MSALRAWMLPVLAALLGGCPCAGAQSASNLVRNGDFRQVADGKPVGWELAGDARTVEQALEIVTDSGRRCARLTCSRITGEGGATHAMLAQVGVVRLEKGRLYEFSCLARESGIRGRSVNVALQDTDGWQPTGLYAALSLTAQWGPLRVTFRATRSVERTGRLQIWFTETGSLYLAAVRIAEVQARQVEFSEVVPRGESRNLVRNGNFSAGPDGWGSIGIAAGWGNVALLHGEVMPDRPRGSHFLRISLGPRKTPTLYFDYLHPVARKQSRLLAASLGWIPVEPGKPYTISCRMRSSADYQRGRIGVVGGDPAGGGLDEGQQRQFPVSLRWNRCVYTFRPNRRYVFVVAGPDLRIGEGADVDIADVQLEKGEQATPYVPRVPVEIGVMPTAPGGVFRSDKPVALTITAANHAARDAEVRVTFRVTDYYERPVPLAPVTLWVQPHSSASRPVDLPGSWRGYYRVRADWRAIGLFTVRRGTIRALASESLSMGTRELRVAIVPPRTSTDSVLGINHAFPDGDLIRIARQAGVTWYRDWSLKRQDIEPTPGRCDWDVSDTQIDRVLAEGVNVMALLPPFPSAEWDSEAPESLRSSGYPGERRRQAWAPRDPAALAAFVTAAAAVYAPAVTVWEFLNEPIYTDYALPADGGSGAARRYTPADYVALLKVAAAAMRKGNPACEVMGGIAGPPSLMTRQILDAGVLREIDILNLHIYPGGRAPEGYAQEMDRLLGDMDAHGDRKPIWITEFSYYAEDDPPRRPFIPGDGSWAEPRMLPTERDCAEYTVRFLAIMLSRGVKKVFLHSGTSGTVNMPEPECCLFAGGGAPRKIFPALAVFTELLGPNPRFVGERSLGGEATALAFDTGKRSVVVAWNPGEGPSAAAPVMGARTVNLMGSSVTADRIPLSSAPVYLVGRAGSAASLLQAVRASLSHRSATTSAARLPEARPALHETGRR